MPKRANAAKTTLFARRFAAFFTLIALRALPTLAIHSHRDPPTN